MSLLEHENVISQGSLLSLLLHYDTFQLPLQVLSKSPPSPRPSYLNPDFHPECLHECNSEYNPECYPECHPECHYICLAYSSKLRFIEIS